VFAAGFRASRVAMHEDYRQGCSPHCGFAGARRRAWPDRSRRALSAAISGAGEPRSVESIFLKSNVGRKRAGHRGVCPLRRRQRRVSASRPTRPCLARWRSRSTVGVPRGARTPRRYPPHRSDHRRR
jgi:hypothetical protein